MSNGDLQGPHFLWQAPLATSYRLVYRTHVRRPFSRPYAAVRAARSYKRYSRISYRTCVFLLLRNHRSSVSNVLICQGLAQPVARKTQLHLHSDLCRNSTVHSRHCHFPVTLFTWQYFVLALTKLGASSHPSSRQHVVPIAVLPKDFFIGGGTVTRHL